MNLAKIRKSVVAAIAAGLTALVAESTSGTLDPPSWGLVIGAMVTAGLTVWAVPNEPETPTPDIPIHYNKDSS